MPSSVRRVAAGRGHRRRCALLGLFVASLLAAPLQPASAAERPPPAPPPAKQAVLDDTSPAPTSVTPAESASASPAGAARASDRDEDRVASHADGERALVHVRRSYGWHAGGTFIGGWAPGLFLISTMMGALGVEREPCFGMAIAATGTLAAGAPMFHMSGEEARRAARAMGVSTPGPALRVAGWTLAGAGLAAGVIAIAVAGTSPHWEEDDTRSPFMLASAWGMITSTTGIVLLAVDANKARGRVLRAQVRRADLVQDGMDAAGPARVRDGQAPPGFVVVPVASPLPDGAALGLAGAW